MNIIEAIKERRSVRNFNCESLTQSQISELGDAVKTQNPHLAATSLYACNHLI